MSYIGLAGNRGIEPRTIGFGDQSGPVPVAFGRGPLAAKPRPPLCDTTHFMRREFDLAQTLLVRLPAERRRRSTFELPPGSTSGWNRTIDDLLLGNFESSLRQFVLLDSARSLEVPSSDRRVHHFATLVCVRLTHTEASRESPGRKFDGRPKGDSKLQATRRVASERSERQWRNQRVTEGWALQAVTCPCRSDSRPVRHVWRHACLH